MRFRKLRIAWSVGCGIAAVLVIGLWVRSYSRADSLVITITKTYQLELQSVPGRCVGFITYAPSRPIKGFARNASAPPEGAAHTFQHHGIVGGDPSMQTAWVAHWLIVLICALVGVAPWGRRFRFSLRTLLIATTLIAVVLGLIVWLASS
jgi:hypothetical protein